MAGDAIAADPEEPGLCWAAPFLLAGRQPPGLGYWPPASAVAAAMRAVPAGPALRLNVTVEARSVHLTLASGPVLRWHVLAGLLEGCGDRVVGGLSAVGSGVASAAYHARYHGRPEPGWCHLTLARERTVTRNLLLGLGCWPRFSAVLAILERAPRSDLEGRWYVRVADRVVSFVSAPPIVGDEVTWPSLAAAEFVVLANLKRALEMACLVGEIELHVVEAVRDPTDVAHVVSEVSHLVRDVVEVVGEAVEVALPRREPPFIPTPAGQRVSARANMSGYMAPDPDACVVGGSGWSVPGSPAWGADWRRPGWCHLALAKPGSDLANELGYLGTWPQLALVLQAVEQADCRDFEPEVTLSMSHQFLHVQRGRAAGARYVADARVGELGGVAQALLVRMWRATDRHESGLGCAPRVYVLGADVDETPAPPPSPVGWAELPIAPADPPGVFWVGGLLTALADGVGRARDIWSQLVGDPCDGECYRLVFPTAEAGAFPLVSTLLENPRWARDAWLALGRGPLYFGMLGNVVHVSVYPFPGARLKTRERVLIALDDLRPFRMGGVLYSAVAWANPGGPARHGECYRHLLASTALPFEFGRFPRLVDVLGSPLYGEYVRLGLVAPTVRVKVSGTMVHVEPSTARAGVEVAVAGLAEFVYGSGDHPPPAYRIGGLEEALPVVVDWLSLTAPGPWRTLATGVLSALAAALAWRGGLITYAVVGCAAIAAAVVWLALSVGLALAVESWAVGGDRLFNFVTFGSRGDRVPVEYYARRFADWGLASMCTHAVTPEEGHMMLDNVERSRFFTLHAVMAKLVGGVTRQVPGVRTIPVIPAAAGSFPVDAVVYDLAPPRRHRNGFNLVDPELPLACVVNLVADFCFVLTRRDVPIGSFSGSAPRSSDGVTLLTPRPNRGLRRTLVCLGSSSVPEPPGLDPDTTWSTRVDSLYRHEPRTDHAEMMADYVRVVTHGGAGTMATAVAAGCEVESVSRMIDRDMKEGAPFEFGSDDTRFLRLMLPALAWPDVGYVVARCFPRLHWGPACLLLLTALGTFCLRLARLAVVVYVYAWPQLLKMAAAPTVAIALTYVFETSLTPSAVTVVVAHFVYGLGKYRCAVRPMRAVMRDAAAATWFAARMMLTPAFHVVTPILGLAYGVLFASCWEVLMTRYWGALYRAGLRVLEATLGWARLDDSCLHLAVIPLRVNGWVVPGFFHVEFQDRAAGLAVGMGVNGYMTEVYLQPSNPEVWMSVATGIPRGHLRAVFDRGQAFAGQVYSPIANCQTFAFGFLSASTDLPPMVALLAILVPTSVALTVLACVSLPIAAVTTLWSAWATAIVVGNPILVSAGGGLGLETLRDLWRYLCALRAPPATVKAVAPSVAVAPVYYPTDACAKLRKLACEAEFPVFGSPSGAPFEALAVANVPLELAAFALEGSGHRQVAGVAAGHDQALGLCLDLAAQPRQYRWVAAYSDGNLVAFVQRPSGRAATIGMDGRAYGAPEERYVATQGALCPVDAVGVIGRALPRLLNWAGDDARLTALELATRGAARDPTGLLVEAVANVVQLRRKLAVFTERLGEIVLRRDLWDPIARLLLDFDYLCESFSPRLRGKKVAWAPILRPPRASKAPTLGIRIADNPTFEVADADATILHYIAALNAERDRTGLRYASGPLSLHTFRREVNRNPYVDLTLRAIGDEYEAPDGVDGMVFACSEVMIASLARYVGENSLDPLTRPEKWRVARSIVASHPELFENARLADPKRLWAHFMKHRNYSAGTPFIGKPGRGELVIKSRADLKRAGWARALQAVATLPLRDGRWFPSISHAFPKSQVIPFEKLQRDPTKVRTVTATSVITNLQKGVLNFDVNNRHDFVNSSAKVGMPLNGFQMSRVFERLDTYRFKASADITAMDSNLSRMVFEIEGMVRKIGYENHVLKDTIWRHIDCAMEHTQRGFIMNLISEGRPEAYRMLDAYHAAYVDRVPDESWALVEEKCARANALTRPWCPGGIISKSKGGYTGDSDTTWTNTIGLQVILMVVLADVHAVPLERFFEEVYLANVGDDNVLGFNFRPDYGRIGARAKELFGVEIRFEATGATLDQQFLGKVPRPAEDHAADFELAGVPRPAFAILHNSTMMMTRFSNLKAEVARKFKGSPLQRYRYMLEHTVGYLGLTAHQRDLYDKFAGYYDRQVAEFGRRYPTQLARLLRGLKKPDYVKVLRDWYAAKHVEGLDHELQLKFEYGVFARSESTIVQVLSDVARFLDAVPSHLVGVEDPDLYLYEVRHETGYIFEAHAYTNFVKRTGCVPSLPEMEALLRQSPFSQFAMPREYLANEVAGLLPGTAALERAYERAQYRLVVYSGLYLVSSKILSLMEMLPMGTALLTAFNVYVFSLPRLYHIANFMHYLGTAESSMALSQAMPKDMFYHHKRVALLVLRLLPDVTPSPWVDLAPLLCLLARVQESVVRLATASAGRGVSMLNTPGLPDTPWDAALPDVLGHLNANRSVVVTAPTGTGKTRVLPKKFLGQLVRGTLIRTVCVVMPRRILCEEYARQGAFYKRRGTTWGGESLVTMTYGHCEALYQATALRHFGEDVLFILDECHELAPEVRFMVAQLQVLRPTICLTATPTEGATGALPVVPVAVARPYEVTHHQLTGYDTWGAYLMVRARTQGRILVIDPAIREVQKLAASAVAAGHRAKAVTSRDRTIPGEDVDIFATSIVDSGINIAGVVAVIDSGWRLGNDRGDLKYARVDKVTAIQRAGRTGRFCPGDYYLLGAVGTEVLTPAVSVSAALMESPLARRLGPTVRLDKFIVTPANQQVALNEYGRFKHPVPNRGNRLSMSLYHQLAVECRADQAQARQLYERTARGEALDETEHFMTLLGCTGGDLITWQAVKEMAHHNPVYYTEGGRSLSMLPVLTKGVLTLFGQNSSPQRPRVEQRNKAETIFVL